MATRRDAPCITAQQSDEVVSRGRRWQQESRARVGRSLPDRSMGRSLRSGSCSRGCESRRGGERSRSCWGRIRIEAIPLGEPRGKLPLRAGANGSGVTPVAG